MGKEYEGKKTVHIPVEVHYLETVLPPRCRNHRYRENAAMVNVEVEAFSGDEAPVALIAREYRWKDYDEATVDECYECKETPYRLANGKLYTLYDSIADKSFLEDEDFRAFSWGSRLAWKRLRHSDGPFEPKEISKDLPEWSPRHKWTPTDAGSLEELSDFAAELVIVDGFLWREANEPAYKIANSGGTPSTTIARHYHASASFEDSLDEYVYHYNANQWGDAVEWIQKYWRASYEPDFDHMDKIEVLIPEAVALPTKAERDSLHHMGCALTCVKRAVKELKESEDADGFLDAEELASLLESHMRIELEHLAERWKRGCAENPITEDSGWLEQSVEAAYQELVS